MMDRPPVHGPRMEMTAARWQLIEQVYAAYFESPPSERDVWLERACAGDADLHREVMSLVASQAEDPLFLDEPYAGLPAPPPDVPDPLSVGAFVGPYRLVRPLGRGGMGDVFLAERERPFRQRAALKVLRRGLDTNDVLRRFEAERQILANLTHPNIARVLDGGTTTDGRPYFVMELVEGLPLTEYCVRHRLPIDDRLRLFLDACAAVQAAHRSLVVHRDLKPSNILVTENGAVKLLDFGIAKILDPVGSDISAPLTRSDFRLMTPGYASPEQVRGAAITTATDVYALGVVLYELLAGRRPFDLTGLPPSEVVRVLCEDHPERPSRVLPARSRLRRRIHGDLDTIVLAAMRKEPDRRYATVAQLADDVTRFLDGRPVAARPDTFAYRAGRFLRRHPWGVASASLVAVLLIGFSGVTALQASRIRAQAEAVTIERDKARQIAGFLTDLFRSADPSEVQNPDISARELLARGASRIDAGLDPLIQAEMLAVLADVHQNLGRYEDAVRLAGRALDLRRAHLPAAHEDVVAAANVLARALRSSERYDQADSLLHSVLGSVPADLEDIAVASSIHLIGMLDHDRGRYNAAEAAYVRSLDLHERLVGREHAATADVAFYLARLRYDQGRLDEADSLFADVLDLRRRLFGRGHPDITAALEGLGRVRQRKADYAASDSLFREALVLRRERLGDDHPSVAAAIHQLAGLRYEMGDFSAAESLYAEAAPLMQAAHGPRSQNLASSLNGLALVRAQRGAFDDAETLLRQSLDIFREQLGDEHPSVAMNRFNLGELLFRKGDDTAAEAMLRDALMLQKKLLGGDHPDVARTMLSLGQVQMRLESYDRAEALFREVVSIRERTLGGSHWRTGASMVHLGRCLIHQDRHAEASAVLNEGLGILKAARGEEDPWTRYAVKVMDEGLRGLNAHASAGG